jgi:ubiquinone/menaquinone biosynthesis C-methylase UbiE
VPARTKGHPVFARYYARVSRAMDTGGMAGYRRRALDGLAGAVIEIGAGNGLNFAHYPAGVTRVLAVEPDPYLRRVAGQQARQAPVPVEVRDGVAERLDAADASFDAAVATLVLCSVTDQRAVLGELHRVVRLGGQLRFIEHVQAGTPGLRRVQHLLDATVWPPLLGGCHTSRDTVAAIASAGFTVERIEEFSFPPARWSTPASPHVSGVAVRGR